MDLDDVLDSRGEWLKLIDFGVALTSDGNNGIGTQLFSSTRSHMFTITEAKYYGNIHNETLNY